MRVENDMQLTAAVAPLAVVQRQQPLSKQQWLLGLSAAFALGGGAGVPYAQPAFAAADKLPFVVPGIGYLFAGSTIIAYGCAATWGWETMIDEVMQGYHQGKFRFINPYTRDISGAFLLAACSGSINFYIVSKYDHSLFYSCLTAIAFAGFDASGYHKLIAFATQLPPLETLRALRIVSCQEMVLKKLIMVFPIGNLLVNSYLSYQAGLELVDNEFAALPFALLALSTFAQDIFSAYETVDEAFSGAAQQIEFVLTRQQALAKLLLQVMTITIIAFATSSDAFIASDNFGPNALGNTLATLAVGSGVILGQYVMRDLVNQGMLYFFKPAKGIQAAPSGATGILTEEREDTPLLSYALHQA